jgi:hypothetical protein
VPVPQVLGRTAKQPSELSQGKRLPAAEAVDDFINFSR